MIIVATQPKSKLILFSCMLYFFVTRLISVVDSHKSIQQVASKRNVDQFSMRLTFQYAEGGNVR